MGSSPSEWPWDIWKRRGEEIRGWVDPKALNPNVKIAKPATPCNVELLRKIQPPYSQDLDVIQSTQLIQFDNTVFAVNLF